MKTKAIIPNDNTLRYYFYFLQERMDIFWRKCEGRGCKWSDDDIFNTYKFTNVYRACDRVSQYLIREVIYKDINFFQPQDVLLRILIFKIFNKIDTWEYLNRFLESPITVKSFDAHKISILLSQRQQITPIFNNAYMMTGCHQKYDYLPTKHEKWLTMVQKEFIDVHLFDDILNAASMVDVYAKLVNCSFLGGFLAYQYTIDFNYTPFLNFSEDSFVKAGIGAIRGIKKCFESYGDEYEDAILYIQQNFEELQFRYGCKGFRPLPNHKPALIDLQNCFCETDKYLRVKMPELIVGNTRIKQKYKESSKSIQFMFPPKWNINVSDLCTKPSIRELTLF